MSGSQEKEIMGIEALVLLVLGSVSGCVAAFLILRPRIRAAAEGARQAAETERAALAERLRDVTNCLPRPGWISPALDDLGNAPPLCGKSISGS